MPEQVNLFPGLGLCCTLCLKNMPTLSSCCFDKLGTNFDNFG